METLFLFVGFVYFTFKAPDFYASHSYYAEFSKCEQEAAAWTMDQSAKEGVREVYGVCLPVNPPQPGVNIVSGDA